MPTTHNTPKKPAIPNRTPHLKGEQGKAARRDWTPVRRDYESGALGPTACATKHGISLNQLCNKARIMGWTKPDKLVQAHAKAALKQGATALAASYSTPGEAPPNARALVRPSRAEDGAQRLDALLRLTADVLLAHRQDIHELAHLSTGQLAELKAATASPDRLFRIIDVLDDLGTLSEEEAKAARRELRSICDLKGRMVALGMLTAQFERLQVMERKAYGIKDDERPEDEAEDIAGILVEFVTPAGQERGEEFPTLDGGRTARRVV